ncbi:unnamed protein product, partial [marine sediment metagenome]
MLGHLLADSRRSLHYAERLCQETPTLGASLLCQSLKEQVACLRSYINSCEVSLSYMDTEGSPTE